MNNVTRRTFLASSAGAVAAYSALQTVSAAEVSLESLPMGNVTGVTGRRGLISGTPSNPGGGTVYLRDGRSLSASHTSHRRVGPGKTVLLSPEPAGRWSVLYAER